MFGRTTLLLAAASCLRLAAAQQTTAATLNDMVVKTDPTTGVLLSLKPTMDLSFDFSPADVFAQRNGFGNYHTGDITFQYQLQGSDDGWKNASSVLTRNINPVANPGVNNEFRSDELTNSFATRSFLRVVRTWSDQDGDLLLSFYLQNTGKTPVEIGALGFPMEFNNILTGRDPNTAASTCSFVEPNIGNAGGYLQVTRLNGKGPNLVITPATANTKFEAWTFLNENTGTPLAYSSPSWEGNYAWQVFSKAFSETTWERPRGKAPLIPWNVPTSLVLQPGAQPTQFAFRFTQVKDVTNIEDTLYNLNIPVAQGIPSMIVPQGSDATLRLYSKVPPGADGPSDDPAGSFEITAGPAKNGIYTYQLKPVDGKLGRVRVDIPYNDSRVQSVNYWISEDSATLVDSMAKFIDRNMFYNDTTDVFGRAPSYMAFDYGLNKTVLQEARAWIAGLSDESGMGSFLTMAMKQFVQPDKTQVNRLEQFAQKVLYTNLQNPKQDHQYAVKRSLFFYDPSQTRNYTYDKAIDFSHTFNRDAAFKTDRTYNYVHVSAVYWALFKVGRIAPGMLTVQTNASAYLELAYNTVNYAIMTPDSGKTFPNTGNANLGLMGEYVWWELIQDLRAEGMQAYADTLYGYMKSRQLIWAGSANPFGSEQVWDNTAEEAVYRWSREFHDDITSQLALNAIHGYDPLVSHWAYSGNAHRWWDFTIAGAPGLNRPERQGHHYASSLNALALHEAVRTAADPSSLKDFYNLRLAFAGQMGALSNVDTSTGFPSMGFHLNADTLQWDNYNGDFGPNFLGHVLGSQSVLYNDPNFGLTAFGGNVNVTAGVATVTPTDTLKRRVFIAPMGIFILIEGGAIDSYVYDPVQGNLNVNFKNIVDVKVDTIVTWSQCTTAAPAGGVNVTSPKLDAARGGWVVSLPASSANTPVTVSWHCDACKKPAPATS